MSQLRFILIVCLRFLYQKNITFLSHKSNIHLMVVKVRSTLGTFNRLDNLSITGLERAFNDNTDNDLEESEDTLDVTKTNYTAKLAEETQIELGTTL